MTVPTKKWLSTKNRSTRRSTSRSPWRQLLSLPIPCHVHWPRSYCQSRARTAAICRKPCFRGPTGCMRGKRCLAPRVGGVRWSGPPSGCFIKCAEGGGRGGVDFGFLSTTTNESVAVILGGKEMPVLFQFDVGDIDCGAILSFWAQGRTSTRQTRTGGRHSSSPQGTTSSRLPRCCWRTGPKSMSATMMGGRRSTRPHCAKSPRLPRCCWRTGPKSMRATIRVKQRCGTPGTRAIAR